MWPGNGIGQGGCVRKWSGGGKTLDKRVNGKKKVETKRGWNRTRRVPAFRRAENGGDVTTTRSRCGVDQPLNIERENQG